MIRRARLVAAVALALATAVASFSLAEPPKKGGGARRPKPTTSAPDAASASVDASRADEPATASADAAATSTVSAAAASPEGDGGVRASPLNPGPGEMPSAANVDAGAIDYDRLLSDIAALRTRVAAVGESLFQSRMAVTLRADGDRGRIAKVTLLVDDGVVYTSPQGFRGDEATPVFSRALAPGRHAVTVDVEREDKENAAFRSAQRSRFIVEVPRDEQLDVALRLEDDSSMGDLPAKKKGEYDVRVRMKATSSPIKR